MNCPRCGATGPCYCSRSQSPARPRNTTPARQYPAPVYRRPPRSHAYSCRCAKCAPFNSSSGDPFLTFIVVAGVAAVAGFWPAMVWHGEGGPTGTAWRWDVHSTIGCCVWWGLWVFGIACWLIGKKLDERSRKPVVPAVLSAPRPVQAPPVKFQAPPICLHVNAVKVDSVLDRQLVWHCWCPDCDPDGKTPLPANFRRPCCGTEPEALHLSNCPHRKPAS